MGIDKGSKMDFYYAILTFDLAVCLKIEDCGQSLLTSKQIIKQWPEFQIEKWTLVGNNKVWKVVVLYYHI